MANETSKVLLPITMVLPYHNEEVSIEGTLRQIEKQTCYPSELIFVDSNSSDKSSEIINHHIEDSNWCLGVRKLNLAMGTQLPSTSKNAGILQASFDYIAFMDFGLIFPSNWLEHAWILIKDEGALFLSGVVSIQGVNAWDNAAVAQSYGYATLHPAMPSSVVHFSAFAEVGLFLPLRAGYDREWPRKAVEKGYKRRVMREIVISYDSPNFASSVRHIFKKSILYSYPTLFLSSSKMAFSYLLIAPLSLFAANLGQLHLIFLIYFVSRCILFPIRKNGLIGYFRIIRIAGFTRLLLAGLLIDLGRFIGVHMRILRLGAPSD